MARKTSTSVQLDPEDEEWARQIAAQNHRSLSYVVRLALRRLRQAMGGSHRLPDMPNDSARDRE